MFRLTAAAAGIGAELMGADGTVAGISTDSRRIAPGDLFVALRGERFDGHAFLEQVRKGGAVGALVDRRGAAGQSGWPLLVVEDTRLGLGDLARWWRTCHAALPIVAVTGSSGKTTVKEMTATILAQVAGGSDRVLATRGNLNNDIGMPLTLLGLKDAHRYAVLEMGMNHAGEISYLTRIARPNVALINNAQPVHLAGLGSVAAVARAKGEILEGLAADGVAVLNYEDAHLGLWRELAGNRRVLTFGLADGADVRGRWQPDGLGGRLAVQTPAGAVDVMLSVPGEHNARNALAALAAALAAGIAPADAAVALAGFNGVSGRLQLKAGRNGCTLIDDTYNANPASMLAAMQVLAARPGRCVLVLGDMGELGPDGATWHTELGRQARALGLRRLEALGELSRETVHAFGDGARHHADADALVAALLPELGPDLTILVKGSRFMRMERVVAQLAADAPSATN